MAEKPEEHAAAAHHDVTMAEGDRPKNTMIITLVIGTVAALIVTVLFIVEFFDVNVRREVERKNVMASSPQLQDLRVQEDQKLNHYSWVNQKAGTLRVPLDRAEELVLKEWEARPAGLVEVKEVAPPPAAPAPGAPAPAPGAPPAPGAAPAPAPAAAPAPAPATPPAPAAAPPAPARDGGTPR